MQDFSAPSARGCHQTKSLLMHCRSWGSPPMWANVAPCCPSFAWAFVVLRVSSLNPRSHRTSVLSDSARLGVWEGETVVSIVCLHFWLSSLANAVDSCCTFTLRKIAFSQLAELKSLECGSTMRTLCTYTWTIDPPSVSLTCLS